MSSRYDIALGRKPDPEPEMVPIVKSKLERMRKANYSIRCPKCNNPLKLQVKSSGIAELVCLICGEKNELRYNP